MHSFIYFIIGLLLGYIIGGGMVEEENSSSEREGRKRRKTKSKEEKVLGLFDKKKKVSNSDVEKLLKVSDSTATKYLQRLEDEGKIVQHGKTGKYTYYTLI